MVANASNIPIGQPARIRKKVSRKIIINILNLFIPKASNIPISLVLSNTAIIIVLTMPKASASKIIPINMNTIWSPTETVNPSSGEISFQFLFLFREISFQVFLNFVSDLLDCQQNRNFIDFVWNSGQRINIVIFTKTLLSS